MIRDLDHPLINRGNRRPFHVRVLTEPHIGRCWSVNLSDTGIGLIGCPRVDEPPLEGDTLELEFELPGSGQRLRARGRVRWRHDAPGYVESATSSLGVLFTGFEGAGLVHLARYLEDMRVRVAVAFASPEQLDAVRAAVGDLVEVEAGLEQADVESIIARGDIATLVVAGDDPVQAMLMVELAAAVSEDNLTFEGRPRDLAARLVYFAPGQAEHLVKLFNESKVFRCVDQGTHAHVLRDAIVAACRDHALRVEQNRMAMELDRNLERERALRKAPEVPEVDTGPGFQSDGMREVVSALKMSAPHKVAVLLQGETGTGKEVLAQLTHRLSDRRDAPFVVQDCGTLTSTLLESELFGHVKGSFTGAIADHPGLFVLADGGTVFLDEIENTAPELQAKLLRVLETGDVRPVGGSRTRRVDVRVIAASNRPLEDEVQAGRFRGDLFYRLNTFTVEVPPLRQRQSDVLPLARYFLDVSNHQLKKGVMGLSADAETALLRYAWPGNVRELRNVVERATLLTPTGELVQVSQLPRTVTAEPAGAATHEADLKSRLATAESELIRGALERSGGVLRRAAKELGMDPATLGRRAKKLGLWPLPGV